MDKATHYPLLFKYRDNIAGSGFLASVAVSGRALMQKEDGRWWMYGVQPAAIADAGDTPQESAIQFRARYRTVLFDFAGEAPTFDAFKSEVESFFNQEEREISELWQNAFEQIRSGKVEPEKPFSELPQEAPEEQESSITVLSVDSRSLSPNDNVLDAQAIAA